ncbi:MAG: DUF72 domain-containing protein [Candidatus Parvarchaeota archaeon]|nr:DUF72 domain-containing protein [Candidatus Jingweiarchaeum tengchongense]MCW1298187.1 DUF72 domain-containing protein [Candidatus Jingweiarchaeum tengchongense]MCW1299985.1 DUF72 domain-containing protein [Candidatus Jingweiarchaeum tengchongense]MCW1305025.1 DUF72 domain-containing protein [Candidatus Jingweiarchaeum tengchongense]MCW1305466.1 DUF72 domain-containing protein [Candidatus Jingweiarchaeum tengchongense]
MIKIGCCGFPKAIEKYAKQFKLVEVQSTFYKLPLIKTVEKWRNIVPTDFEFTIKCFQGISHPTNSPTWKRSGLNENEIKRLSDKVGFLRPTSEVLSFWNETLQVCKTLKSKICLIQLPSSFKENEENKKNMKKFFSSIKRDEISIAIELRGWSDKGIEEVCKVFDLIDVCDPFARQPTFFSKKKIAYFRLHGSPPGKRMYSYKYTRKDLESLLKKINEIKRSVKEVYCLFNNIYMWKNAKQFQFLNL